MNQETPFQTTDVTKDMNLQIITESDGSWIVRTRFRKSNLLSLESTVVKLREIKQYIAKKFGETFEALEFSEITESSDNKLYLMTSFRVRRAKLAKGPTAVKLHKQAGLEGYEFPNMLATIDVYPIDQFDQMATLERVEQIARGSKITEKCIEPDKIIEAFMTMNSTKKPVIGHPFAFGKLPEPARDAEIEFYLAAEPDASNIDLFISSRRISKGDYICRKIEPAAGKEPGYNLFGEPVSCSNGLDVEIKTGHGASMSAYGFSVMAEIDGVVQIERTTRRMMTAVGEKIMPISITVSVQPIQVIDSADKVDLATDQPVEIRGNLKFGSEIISTSEVYVTGNVEGNVRIQSQDNIVVGGDVTDAKLVSGNHLVVRGNVAGSQISARDKVVVEGNVSNAMVSGETVQMNSFSGGKIVANQSITLNKIDVDEDKIVSSIVLGMSSFYKQRIKENDEFIQKADSNLKKLQEFFGQQVFDDLRRNTPQVAFVHFLAHMRKEHQKPLQQIEMAMYRRLMEAIPPTLSLVTTRKQENISLMRRLEDATTKGGAVLTVRERISADAVIKIDDVEEKLKAPIEGTIQVRAGEEGKLDVQITEN